MMAARSAPFRPTQNVHEPWSSSMSSVRTVSLTAVLAATLALALAGCGGKADKVGSPKVAAPMTLEQECEAFFTRARACTDPYLEQLVAVRIELDKPESIAAEAEAEGKDALVSKAREEWANDSTPDAIAANCNQMSGQVPPDQVEAMQAAGERCLATTDCDAFAVCAADIHRARLAGS